MSNFLFRKGGVPALASLSPALSSPCLCSLVVEVNEPANQATIQLQFGLHARESRIDERLSLIYDGDILEPGTTIVRDVTISPEHMEQIARRGSKRLRSLHLTLRQPCIVLLSSVAPIFQNRHDPLVEQLATIAKATDIHIVFDSAWLHPSKVAGFRFLERASELTGCPRKSAQAAQEADWTIFIPGEPAPPELPPPYSGTSKRHRQSASNSPCSPRPKRVLLDPDLPIDLGSPTEKATTTTSSSPRRPPSPLTLDPLEAAVERAVAKLLPAAIRDVLPEVLPEVIARVVAAPEVSPSPQAAPALPNPMSPLHKMVRDHLNSRAAEVAKELNTRAEALAKEITTDTHGHALYLRETADLELEECLQDHRFEFAVLKEEGLMEMHRACDKKLEQVEARMQELEQRSHDLVESVEQETSQAYTTVVEKLEEFVGEQRIGLVKAALGIPQTGHATQWRRARSLPLGMG